MDADGSHQTRLTQNATSDSIPAWSPDGKKIAFVSADDGQGEYATEYYTMNADGSNLTRFSTIFWKIEDWAWSRDGVRTSSPKIVFGVHNQIHVWEGNGLETFPSNLTTLTIRPVVASSPDWSPDGKEIVYVSERHGRSQIFVMNADGSNPVALTGDGSRKYSPAWSPAIAARPDCTSDWTRLEAGGWAKVAEDNTTPNRVRSGPSTADEIIAQLPPGAVVKLIEGPVCAGGLVFWKVESDLIPGGAGWTTEGDMEEYYLELYQP
jgi:dipeptidyl aminopeptidase/acylaminoacyl peptidase